MVIQGYRFQSKAISLYNFLLVINSNFGRISYRLRDIDAFSSKLVFLTLPRLTPPSEERPAIINVIYTPLKITFNGLQFHRKQYGSIFIRLAVFGSQICEIPRNSQKIRSYSRSRSSEVIDLAINRKCICDFLLFM